MSEQEYEYCVSLDLGDYGQGSGVIHGSQTARDKYREFKKLVEVAGHGEAVLRRRAVGEWEDVERVAIVPIEEDKP
jgi:hypothetical protein